jgi:signal transduction histidine kinase
MLFYPAVPALREPPPELFREGDLLEFRREDYDGAVQALKTLTGSPDRTVRAGALLRIARNLRKSGKPDAALEAFAELAGYGDVAIRGVPAELVARRARCTLLSDLKQPDQARKEAASLYADLRGGRWQLDRAQYEVYADESAAMSGGDRTSEAAGLALSEGVAWLWDRWRQGPPQSGRETVFRQGRALAVVWESAEARLTGLVAGPRFLEREQADELERFAARRRLLLSGLALVAILLATVAWLIARTFTREMAIAHLQSDFVAAVSHEFRTPLTSLRQLSEVFSEDRPLEAERRRKYYQALDRATGRLNSLVEGLLDFGRMEAGAKVYTLRRVDAGALVTSVVDEFQREAELRGYQVELNRGGSLPETEADAEALGRALWNLLDNAVKYSPDSKTVWVAVERQDGKVAVRVRDCGLGIPASEQRQILKKFVRGSAANHTGIKGTGIGLAMVQHIVQAHRGELRLESKPGEGSTFTILLPAKE